MRLVMDNMTVEAATELQRLAANPLHQPGRDGVRAHSRMVNANAGSGKTKVLVDRVSRILLQGTEPGKVLCLTYTRAAAAEMQERLFKTLSDWSVASDEVLREKLFDLYGYPPEQASPPVDLDTARTSFARALETPEGLKVMTIHAFCERIIARFPVEAGILPGFSPLDDSEAKTMLAESRERLLERAMQDEGLATALHRLTRLKADSTLDDLLFGLSRNYDKTLKWAQGGGLAGFRKRVGLRDGDTELRIAQAALDETDTDRLARLAEIARRVWKNADGFIDVVARVSDPTDHLGDLNAYGNIFLTAKGEPRKRVLVQAVHKEDDFLQLDGAEMRRVVAALDRMRAARLADTTDALLTLGHAMTLDHARAKHQARGLDFNDLIVKTRDLLQRKSVSDWVAYKLDGGVDHVLLDEAQDTSPEQWDIIDAITEPFAQDSPDRDEPPRTFFAVGDPKQSIYRFQGAAPELFMGHVRERGGAQESVQLRMSFRSAQQVLDVVDALFTDGDGLKSMFPPDTTPEANDIARHKAFRADEGCVELWPLAPAADKLEDREAWDTTPVDETGNADPRVVLAREIAGTIDHWVRSGEPVYDRDLKAHRPMHAGDVLILVQKRVGGLFEAIIKALKEEGLPVAGADRLVLQDATVVRDLLAITRFVLLPGDCLSLAEALKSPLFGLNDDQLFDLCVDRGDQLLWQAVQERSETLTAALRDILADAQLAPYDFYARLLDRRGPHGKTYREALFSRLGMEAREALEAFLGQALSHQQQRAPSLLRFMQAFEADQIEIKRDKDPAGGEVRVMTVHGAKGLEAPVVFLPDTTRVPRKSSGALIGDGEGGYILAPSGADSFELAERLKDEDYAHDMREYMRLLYVAMTRAESRLVLCGYHHGRGEQGFADDSWYHWFLRVIPGLEGVEEFATSFDGGGMQGLRFGKRVEKADATGALDASAPAPLPDWIDRMAAPELPAATEATPSHLLRTHEPVGRGPGAGGNYMRGIVIHKLLEHLPDHPPGERDRITAAMLDGYPDFVESERTAIRDQVFAVLEAPEFADVFAHGSRAEVSLAGRIDLGGKETFMTAQVDRLSVVGNTVFLVDYKSGHAPPESVDDIDVAYLAQMAAYRELARAVWPTHTLRCGLLWTEGPALTWLPEASLDAALKQVGDVLTS